MSEEIKRETEIKKFECPFCRNKKVLKVHDKIFNEQTGESVGYGIDYWECDKCGAENDLGLESFEDNFKAFRRFTDNNDWKGLYDFCKNNDFDKALKTAEVLIKLYTNDADAEIIIKNAKLGIKNMQERRQNDERT